MTEIAGEQSAGRQHVPAHGAIFGVHDHVTGLDRCLERYRILVALGILVVLGILAVLGFLPGLGPEIVGGAKG